MEENIEKKPMVNIMIYHTIANNDDDIKLSIMEGNKGLYASSIEFKLEGEHEIFWDNPDFIFGTLLESLKRFRDRKMTNADEIILENLTWLNEDYCLDIIEIIEKGIELGWNKVKL